MLGLLDFPMRESQHCCQLSRLQNRRSLIMHSRPSHRILEWWNTAMERVFVWLTFPVSLKALQKEKAWATAFSGILNATRYCFFLFRLIALIIRKSSKYWSMSWNNTILNYCINNLSSL